MHPALLDACLQVAGGAITGDAPGEALLPIGIDRVELLGDASGVAWVHARCTARGEVTTSDLTVTSAEGRVLLVVRGLHVRRAPAELLHGARSEEHTSELQSLMRISYAVFCLKKKTKNHRTESKL